MKDRVKFLNNLEPNSNGRYILYWMQQSCRVHYNHALTFAVEEANRYNLPLVVCFGVTDTYPEANERHYYFMLEGLQEVKEELEEMGATFVLRKEEPWRVALKLSQEAMTTIVDKGYLRHQRAWRESLNEKITTPLIEIESDLIVPVEIASKHEVERAYIMRDKIEKRIKRFLEPVTLPLISNKTSIALNTEGFSDIPNFLSSLNIDRSVKRSNYFTGGYSQAKLLLNDFIENKLVNYNDERNIPTVDMTSKLSAYLHFGQISSLEIYLTILSHKYSFHTIKSYYNELVTWRELCYNFCYYNNNYDSLEGFILLWAKETLSNHLGDKREYVYSLDELEKAITHDTLWNASQLEMVKTGRMHGYIRMYWCKKIIEWSKIPSEAYEISVYLNNRYELDGRDPNGYGGIAWCFGKHDRPVFETPILGRVRSSSKEWLAKNFDIDRYIDWVEAL